MISSSTDDDNWRWIIVDYDFIVSDTNSLVFRKIRFRWDTSCSPRFGDLFPASCDTWLSGRSRKTCAVFHTCRSCEALVNETVLWPSQSYHSTTVCRTGHALNHRCGESCRSKNVHPYHTDQRTQNLASSMGPHVGLVTLDLLPSRGTSLFESEHLDHTRWLRRKMWWWRFLLQTFETRVYPLSVLKYFDYLKMF